MEHLTIDQLKLLTGVQLDSLRKAMRARRRASKTHLWTHVAITGFDATCSYAVLSLDGWDFPGVFIMKSYGQVDFVLGDLETTYISDKLQLMGFSSQWKPTASSTTLFVTPEINAGLLSFLIDCIFLDVKLPLRE